MLIICPSIPINSLYRSILFFLFFIFVRTLYVYQFSIEGGQTSYGPKGRGESTWFRGYITSPKFIHTKRGVAGESKKLRQWCPGSDYCYIYQWFTSSYDDSASHEEGWWFCSVRDNCYVAESKSWMNKLKLVQDTAARKTSWRIYVTFEG